MWLALRAAPLQTSAILPMFPRKRRKDSSLMRRAFLPLRSGGRCRLQAPERLRTAELARRASAGRRESGGWGPAQL